MSDDKACWKDLYWFVRIVFILKKRGVGNVAMSQGCKGMPGPLGAKIRIPNPGHGSLQKI